MSEKLIKLIKEKTPTLEQLKIILKKHKITTRDEIQKLMINYDLLKYIKKDKKFMSIKRKADKKIDNAYKELSGKPFKKAIKELKLQYTNKKNRKTRKTRKNKKNNNI